MPLPVDNTQRAREAFADALDREGARGQLSVHVRTGIDNSHGGSAAVYAINKLLQEEWDLRPGRQWRHVKTGHTYEIVAVGIWEPDLQPSVVYRSLIGEIWIRPRSVFLQQVYDDTSSSFKRRFEPL